MKKLFPFIIVMQIGLCLYAMLMAHMLTGWVLYDSPEFYYASPEDVSDRMWFEIGKVRIFDGLTVAAGFSVVTFVLNLLLFRNTDVRKRDLLLLSLIFFIAIASVAVFGGLSFIEERRFS